MKISWLANPKIRFSILTAIVVLSIIAGRIFHITPNQINQSLGGLSLIHSAIFFFVLYIIGGIFLWYIKDPLKIVGAVVFGAYLSTLLIYLAEIIDAVIYFNLSKILGKEYVESKLTGKYQKFYQRVESLNFGWVFILRSVPLIPYRVLNLTFGISRFSFKKYMIVTVIGSLPRIFWIQFILASLGDIPLLKGISFKNLNASLEVMVEYFQLNSTIFNISVLYFFLAAIAAFKLKSKFFHKETNKKD